MSGVVSCLHESHDGGGFLSPVRMHIRPSRRRCGRSAQEEARAGSLRSRGGLNTMKKTSAFLLAILFSLPAVARNLRVSAAASPTDCPPDTGSGGEKRA